MELWNLFTSPDFDLVQNSDAFSKVQPLLVQIAQAEPHLVLACQSLEHWVSKTLRHISMIKEILAQTVDPEDVLEDHYDNKTRYL
ncbi:hypothetical protein Pyn_25697 [Prunus yedoensis var. nudiflora]|uniref:Uncharacterized protein n=1 Tax=Prunus yedoensis var. nudiflora TaxID=2094558 RepID=A0A314YQJ2_PRUYE|nr:hypothetical protein Pyn_25697 [Prunus yedoensis var. nudiflora]